MEHQIRQAVPEDAEDLSAIARAAKAHWGYPGSWLRAWDPILRVTPGYVRRNVVWVASQAQQAIGFYALEDRQTRWALEHLWVDPAHHGRGAGRQLFRHAVQTVRDLRPGVLIIEAEPHSVGFYTRMGAVVKGSVAAPVEDDAGRVLPVLEVRVDAP